MPEFYVEVAVWIEADDEDAAATAIARVLADGVTTAAFDILGVEEADA